MKEHKEDVVAFMQETKALFNKFADLFIKADTFLEKGEYENFKAFYRTQSQEYLAEMAHVQHLKVNETFGLMKQRSDNLMAILRDISNCRDFVAFGELQKKARAILMAQDMVDRGKPIQEVEDFLQKAETGETHQSIIVQ